ncbi:MAG TPA: exonuclease domain-containing protein [Tepidisphaeraceae bacterium]|jgi:DNA polymerase III epsilon subunit family exonuclease|nr:exonuclease domain-containing protein [Tepidisphaeraceae bacterium]
MPFSLIQPLFSIPIACVDVETTGASAEFGDRIVEIGIVRYENGQKAAEYQQLIDPRRRISPGATALTGITQAMCDGQPTFSQQLAAMSPLLAGAAVLGHNVRFDLSFLAREFRAAGQDICQTLNSPHVFDTVRIARRRFGRGGNGLGSLARRLGYEPPNAHRALPDALTTAVIFDLLLSAVGGWNISLCDVLKEQGGPMSLLPASARESLLPLELEEALDHRRPVLMEYLDAGQTRTRRVVDPIEVRRIAGELVLIAHCHLRNDRRNFKLDRIVQLSRIDPADAGCSLNLVPGDI